MEVHRVHVPNDRRHLESVHTSKVHTAPFMRGLRQGHPCRHTSQTCKPPKHLLKHTQASGPPSILAGVAHGPTSMTMHSSRQVYNSDPPGINEAQLMSLRAYMCNQASP
eukprot:scaffold245159_cov15-Tisochrysis_lutea.AAC.1